MNELYEKAIEAYVKMLMIHIDTKTTDVVFHKETEEFYNTIFDTAHKIGEKFVDLGGNLDNSILADKKKQANSIITNLRKDIENYKNSNEVTLGTEDLLGSLANNLENIEGTSKGFLR